MKLNIVRNRNWLLPAFDSDKEIFNKIVEGEIFEIEYKKPRSTPFHRKMFALLNMIFANQDDYNSLTAFRTDLLIKLGFYKERKNKFTDLMIKEAQSLAYSNCDQILAEKIYNAVIDYYVIEWKTNKPELEDQLTSFY